MNETIRQLAIAATLLAIAITSITILNDGPPLKVEVAR